jgi:hypothetical protein
MRAIFDRMLRPKPREIVLQFQRISDPALKECLGILATSQKLSKRDREAIRECFADGCSSLVDGQTVRI